MEDRYPKSGDFTIGDATDLLDTLMAYSGDVIKILDLDGIVVSWNSACEELYGWTATEAVGRRLPHIPEEMRLRIIADNRAIAASGRVVEREAEAARRDGTGLTLRLVVIPVLDEEGHPAGVLSIGREAASCTRLDRERTEFLSHVDSALKGPLAAIASSGQLLSRPEIACDASRRARVVDSLLESAKAAADAVEELLVISNLSEPGRAGREPLDLTELATSAASTLGDDDPVLVEFAASPALVLGDPVLLERAIADMIGACSAADRERGVVVSVSLDGREAVVAVEALGVPGGFVYGDRPSGGSTEGALKSVLARASAVARSHGGSLKSSAGTDSYTLEMRVPVC